MCRELLKTSARLLASLLGQQPLEQGALAEVRRDDADVGRRRAALPPAHASHHVSDSARLGVQDGDPSYPRFPEIPRDSTRFPEIPRDSQRFPEIAPRCG